MALGTPITTPELGHAAHPANAAAMAPWLQAVLLILLATVPAGWSLAQPFYGDDAVSLLDARDTAHDWHAAWGLGHFSRFRPLRLLSLGAIYAVVGHSTTLPYHLLCLALHAVNVLLAWRLVRRLLAAAGMDGAAASEAVAFAAAGLFAVHWAASEAATYISAIGMLYVALGTFIACLGVVGRPGSCQAASPTPNAPAAGRAAGSCLRDIGLLFAGLVIMILGGEYCIAGVTPVICCAFWPRLGSAGKLSIRRGLRLGTVAALTGLGYLLAQKFFIARRFDSQLAVSFDAVEHLVENIARLAFPLALMQKSFVFILVLGAPLAITMLVPALRRRLARPAYWLLLVAALGAIAPFAPSTMGNYRRFVYIACPFFVTWLLGLLLPVAEAVRGWIKAGVHAKANPWPPPPSAEIALPMAINGKPQVGGMGKATQTPCLGSSSPCPNELISEDKERSSLAGQFRVAAIVVAVLVAGHIYNLNMEIGKARKRGLALQAFTSGMIHLAADNPGRRVTVCVTDDDEEHALDMLELLGAFSRDQLFHNRTPGPLASGEIRVHATCAQKTAYNNPRIEMSSR